MFYPLRYAASPVPEGFTPITVTRMRQGTKTQTQIHVKAGPGQLHIHDGKRLDAYSTDERQDKYGNRHVTILSEAEKQKAQEEGREAQSYTVKIAPNGQTSCTCPGFAGAYNSTTAERVHPGYGYCRHADAITAMLRLGKIKPGELTKPAAADMGANKKTDLRQSGVHPMLQNSRLGFQLLDLKKKYRNDPRMVELIDNALRGQHRDVIPPRHDQPDVNDYSNNHYVDTYRAIGERLAHYKDPFARAYRWQHMSRGLNLDHFTDAAVKKLATAREGTGVNESNYWDNILKHMLPTHETAVTDARGKMHKGTMTAHFADSRLILEAMKGAKGHQQEFWRRLTSRVKKQMGEVGLRVSDIDIIRSLVRHYYRETDRNELKANQKKKENPQNPSWQQYFAEPPWRMGDHRRPGNPERFKRRYAMSEDDPNHPERLFFGHYVNHGAPDHPMYDVHKPSKFDYQESTYQQQLPTKMVMQTPTEDESGDSYVHFDHAHYDDSGTDTVANNGKRRRFTIRLPKEHADQLVGSFRENGVPAFSHGLNRVLASHEKMQFKRRRYAADPSALMKAHAEFLPRLHAAIGRLPTAGMVRSNPRLSSDLHSGLTEIGRQIGSHLSQTGGSDKTSQMLDEMRGHFLHLGSAGTTGTTLWRISGRLDQAKSDLLGHHRAIQTQLSGPSQMQRRYAANKPMRYLTNCVQTDDGDAINDMVDSAEDLSREDFLKHVHQGDMGKVEKGLGYGPDFPMARDWHVSYHKGKYLGKPVAFFVHSAIEHIFSHDGDGWSARKHPRQYADPGRSEHGQLPLYDISPTAVPEPPSANGGWSPGYRWSQPSLIKPKNLPAAPLAKAPPPPPPPQTRLKPGQLPPSVEPETATVSQSGDLGFQGLLSQLQRFGQASIPNYQPHSKGTHAMIAKWLADNPHWHIHHVFGVSGEPISTHIASSPDAAKALAMRSDLAEAPKYQRMYARSGPLRYSEADYHRAMHDGHDLASQHYGDFMEEQGKPGVARLIQLQHEQAMPGFKPVPHKFRIGVNMLDWMASPTSPYARYGDFSTNAYDMQVVRRSLINPEMGFSWHAALPTNDAADLMNQLADEIGHTPPNRRTRRDYAALPTFSGMPVYQSSRHKSGIGRVGRAIMDLAATRYPSDPLHLFLNSALRGHHDALGYADKQLKKYDRDLWKHYNFKGLMDFIKAKQSEHLYVQDRDMAKVFFRPYEERLRLQRSLTPAGA